MPARRQRKQKPQQERVFHLFGRLPTELRLEIWKRTWEPRTVTLYPIEHGTFLRPRGGNLLPASGYVNAESRSETLRYYKRCFDHGDKTDFRWFNFHLDTLCIATYTIYLSSLDPTELRQIQRLILPEDLPGFARDMTPCRNTWPKPVTESFESAEVEENLQEYYPSLREITLTTSHWGPWRMGRGWEGVSWEDRYACFRCESKFGHMRTAYIGKLKIRHSPNGKRTFRHRYGYRLSEHHVEFFLGMIADLLVYGGPEPDDSSETET
ncbi:hypothetical protein GGR51DRAFT_171247 [Nemania sp. FL0031]|nr:hypothetical protein GGR51DRAFT_171247 [Nemania sp. FL0031]